MMKHVRYKYLGSADIRKGYGTCRNFQTRMADRL